MPGLMKAIESVADPIIILADGNGHHEAWGNRPSNTRGRIIHDFATEMNLHVLNDGSSTFIRGQQDTAIDISLASSTIANRLMWKTDKDSAGSDHIPIWINANIAPETSRRPRWLYKKADWMNFQFALASTIDSQPTANQGSQRSILARLS